MAPSTLFTFKGNAPLLSSNHGKNFLFLIIGIILKFFILRTLIHYIETLIFKIPLVRPVYSGIKQLVQAFSMQDKITFKQVVIVEFPRKDIYSLGFLTRSE